MDKLSAFHHQQFVGVLNESDEAVVFFAKYLKWRHPDWNILLPLDLYEEGYSDNGDIFIQEGERPLQVLEVKQLSKKITTAEDFPYDTIIVNSYPGIHSKKKEPDAHILLSSDRAAYIMINSVTSIHWELKRKYDSRKEKYLLFYECPVQYAHFYEIQYD